MEKSMRERKGEGTPRDGGERLWNYGQVNETVPESRACSSRLVAGTNLTPALQQRMVRKTFIFICLPLYFRFNFSLFVAALANGDASGRGEGWTLHGADRNAEATGCAFPSFFQLPVLL